jgi:hypothetical protein
MTGVFLRGAFVQWMETFLIPAPNVVVFQFNPESIVHAWTQARAERDGPGAAGGDPLAVSGMPGESFTFTLAMDANDMIADGSPVANVIATASGIYSRLAALEMLLHPTGSTAKTLVGTVSAATAAATSGSATGGTTRAVPAGTLPVVLFVWGPGRILPVRVESLSVTETLYDPTLLNPIHATAQISLKVLTPLELQYVKGTMGDIARAAYIYSQGLRETLALSNLANATESIIGMLPI